MTASAMTREQIIAAAREAFAAEIKPADLVQSHLYDGAAGCVAGRVADVLATPAPLAIPKWEEYAHNTERLPVEGGWLYRTCAWVELPSRPDEQNQGYMHWSDPVFVPSPGGRP